MHELNIRYSAEEKEAIVLSVKRSELSIVQALKRLGIPRRTFYNWYQKYATGGVNALREMIKKAIVQWVKYYNESRFHELLDNLTPRDV